MTWALKAHAIAGSGGASNTATTGGVDTTGADLIVLSIGYFSTGALGTISDSKGNTWTALTNHTNGANTSLKLYYSQAPTVGAAHTFSAAGSGTYLTIAAMAFSGSTSTPFDVEHAGGGAASTSGQPGSITPAGTGELLILTGAFGSGISSTAPTANDSFSTAVDFHQGSSGVDFGLVDFWLSDANANAINPTITWTGAAEYEMDIAAFKPAAGGGFTAVNRRTLGPRVGSRGFY